VVTPATVVAHAAQLLAAAPGVRAAVAMPERAPGKGKGAVAGAGAVHVRYDAEATGVRTLRDSVLRAAGIDAELQPSTALADKVSVAVLYRAGWHEGARVCACVCVGGWVGGCFRYVLTQTGAVGDCDTGT
jgi:hypothetical protein